MLYLRVVLFGGATFPAQKEQAYRLRILEKRIIFFNWYSGGWSPIGSNRHFGHQWPIVPASGDYDDGKICGMIGIGKPKY
jgi:hypothetical protein